MKKIFVVLVLLILFSLLFLPLNTSLADNNPTGRWAEKISERGVMDIIPDKNNNEYQIFITGNLVYRYYSHDDANAYQYDGQTLMLPWSENAMNCFVSGDTLEIEGETFTRTHELDDFLLN